MSGKHSSIVGGSTAARLLNCPGSYQATLRLPPSADISSEYANEGSAMHEVMNHLMSVRMTHEMSAHLRLDLHAVASKLLGVKFYDRELTQEHLDTMILPALDALDVLEARCGGNFEVLAVEVSVDFPGIPGAHGTCDLILGADNTVLHIDWKFGQGIGVKAVYEDEHGATVNAQLLFYVAGAMNSAKSLYSGRRKIALAIIQPRSAEPLTHAMVSRKEIKWFIEDLKNAVIKALDYDPIRQKGEWCRFAPCKIDCPLWTAPMLDLAALKPVSPRDAPGTLLRDGPPSPYGAYLARAKALVDMLSLFSKEVNDQLHSYLSDGGEVPGWRLKAKAKQRQWVDELTVEKALTELGFDAHDVFDSKLVTFKSAEATAKRLGVAIPDHLRVAPATTETTVCRTDDPAPVIEKRVVIEEFAKALQKL